MILSKTVNEWVSTLKSKIYFKVSQWKFKPIKTYGSKPTCDTNLALKKITIEENLDSNQQKGFSTNEHLQGLSV